MTKTTKIHILYGAFTDEWSIQPIDGGIGYIKPVAGFVWDYTWEYAEVESLEFLYENVSGGGMSYSPGWGFLGAETFGVAGLVLGAKRDNVFRAIYFVCTLKDGRKFTAWTSANSWDEWRRLIAKPFESPDTKSAFQFPTTKEQIKAFFKKIYHSKITLESFVMGCIFIPFAVLLVLFGILAVIALMLVS